VDSNSNGLKIETKTDSSTGNIIVRSTGTLSVPVAHVFKMIVDANIRRQWDTVFRDFSVIQNISAEEDFAHWWLHAPWPVSNRDFVVRRRFKNNVGGFDYVIIVNSESHNSKPVTSSYVRAAMINAVTVLRQVNSSTTEMIGISQVNLNGNVPQWLVNQNAAGGAKDFYANIQSCYSSLKNKGVF